MPRATQHPDNEATPMQCKNSAVHSSAGACSRNQNYYFLRFCKCGDIDNLDVANS
jgi:hypothetical protein